MAQGSEPRLVLVDAHDRPVGVGEKLAVHREGLLHRAFSVYVVDPSGRSMLQRRAASKYHSAGRWSNACCGHPREGESVRAAAERRLREEMGLACDLEQVGVVAYRLVLENGLIENEIDHVLVGRSSETPRPDPAEVDAWRLATDEEIDRELREAPERYTPWFPLVRAAVRRGEGSS